MSGLEALGVAASIIQVADLGTKLSVKLFSFYRQVKNANESIQLLSNEVALMSAILRELGGNLKEEEPSKLCSDEAFRTLEHVLDQCRDVLRQIERVVGINDHFGKTRLQQVTGKFRLVLLEPSLDPLKTNLERLKSTMLLLLNVIMFTGQIRSDNTSILQEQRALIEILLQEKQENGGEPFLPKHNQDQRVLKSRMTKNPSKENTRQSNEFAELDDYNGLIRNMLHEIDFCKSKLENSRHSRIRKGVLSIHDGEIIRFQLTHGHSVLHHIDKSLLVDKDYTSQNPGGRTAAPYAIHDNVRELEGSENPPQTAGRGMDFTTSHHHNNELRDENDDESDDGFFANSPTSKRVQKPEPEKKTRKPSDTVITDNNSPHRVNFISPNTTSGESFEISGGDACGSKKAGFFSEPASFEDERGPRRESFANTRDEVVCTQQEHVHQQADREGGGGRSAVGRSDARGFSYGDKAPPPDYTPSKVTSDDLRRLRATRKTNQPVPFSPWNLLGSRNSSGRKNLGPGGNLVPNSDDSAASSCTGISPVGKKEENEALSSINAFSALAALEDRDNMATSLHSNPTSPALTKSQPTILASRPLVEGSIKNLDDLPPNVDLDGKMRAEMDNRHHEAEERSHPDSPSAMKTSIALQENFEELLLRWTKLGLDEVRALEDPKFHILASVCTT